MMESVYARMPICLHGTIPVFSVSQEYTENYEKISQDHLASLHKDGTNPFIPEDLWVECENSTIRLIQKYSKPGDRILDIGVGLGRILSHFSQLERYGMDISFGYLEIAQSKGIDVCYALIEDMPYLSEYFDLIVCTDVLEHVLDLNMCCAKILSVLRNGGVLIARVPYKEDLSAYSDPTYPYKYAHVRRFDEESLEGLFKQIFGCNLIERVKTGYAPRPNRLRYPFRFPKRDTLLIRCFAAMKQYDVPLQRLFLKRLFLPLDINVVVKGRTQSAQNG